MTDETHCKLCGWSDDQQKAELAMEWAGLWPQKECSEGREYSHGSPYKCTHGLFLNRPHAIRCPDPLHDDAVAMRLLEAIAKRDHVCSISITTHQGKWWVLIENYGSKPRFEGIGDSLGLAIGRAAAALAEMEKTLPQHG